MVKQDRIPSTKPKETRPEVKAEEETKKEIAPEKTTPEEVESDELDLLQQELAIKQKEASEYSKLFATKKEEYEKIQAEIRKMKLEEESQRKELAILACKIDKLKSQPILRKVTRISDIIGIPYQSIDALPEKVKSRSTNGYAEFSITDADIEEATQLLGLKITVPELELIVRRLFASHPPPFHKKMSMSRLKQDWTGQVTYITYTGVGFIVRMVKFLYYQRCTCCHGIMHDLHSCDDTFAKFPPSRDPRKPLDSHSYQRKSLDSHSYQRPKYQSRQDYPRPLPESVPHYSQPLPESAPPRYSQPLPESMPRYSQPLPESVPPRIDYHEYQSRSRAHIHSGYKGTAPKQPYTVRGKHPSLYTDGAKPASH